MIKWPVLSNFSAKLHQLANRSHVFNCYHVPSVPSASVHFKMIAEVNSVFLLSQNTTDGRPGLETKVHLLAVDTGMTRQSIDVSVPKSPKQSCGAVGLRLRKGASIPYWNSH